MRSSPSLASSEVESTTALRDKTALTGGTNRSAGKRIWKEAGHVVRQPDRIRTRPRPGPQRAGSERDEPPDRRVLDPGDYQLFCNIPGHLESGQVTAFKVTD